MRLVIFLIIIIVFIIIFYKNNKEHFFSTNINLGNKVLNSRNNIFLGYTKDESEILKEQLEKEREFDMTKSNFILSNDSSRNFTNISLDKNIIQETELQELITGVNENKISYYNKETDDNNQENDVPVLYNHKDKEKGIDPPNKLCIENECIEKKHIGMANGSHTLKLNHNSNRAEYVIPIYTYSGGTGKPRYGHFHNEHAEHNRPFEFIFYQWNKLVNDPEDYGKNANVTHQYLPHWLDDDYDIHDIHFKYKDFKYFALYNAYSKSYLDCNGVFPLRSNKLKGTCMFQFAGHWHGIHGRLVYHLFANYNMPFSLPIGIQNVVHGKWLCHEKHGWGHHYNCGITAVINRPWFYGWEEMHLVRTVPISQGNNNQDIYIASTGCWSNLSAWKPLPFCHFSSNWSQNDPNIYGHNVWKIIPLPDTCGEKCKADFNTNTSCQPPFCHSNIERNIPKNLQCPIDRPICRYYNGNHEGTWLGTCTKEGNMPPASGSVNNPNHLKPISDYRYAKPDQRIFRTNYNNDPLQPEVPEEEQNKDFYSEYSIRVAKNEKGKYYDPDVFKHFHDHEHNS